MNLCRFYTFILSSLLLQSCASSQLVVESDPVGSDVSVVGVGNTRQKIGKTPMTLTKENTPELFSKELQISVTKDGFHGESFLIPPASGSTQARVQASLMEDAISKTCQDSAGSLSEATDAVAQVQRMIYGKNYAEAERVLTNYIVKFNAVPVFHGLLGNVRYLQRNLDKALESYQRSIALQPQNQETLRMIEKIKGIRGEPGGRN